jgi:hypothetical protein
VPVLRQGVLPRLPSGRLPALQGAIDGRLNELITSAEPFQALSSR